MLSGPDFFGTVIVPAATIVGMNAERQLVISRLRITSHLMAAQLAQYYPKLFVCRQSESLTSESLPAESQALLHRDEVGAELRNSLLIVELRLYALGIRFQN